MGKTTQYPSWELSSGFGASVGVGAVGAQIANYELKGNRRETFKLTFVGAGVGGSVGVSVSHVLDHLISGGNSVVSNQSGPRGLSASTGIRFAGGSRSATSFEGGGTVFDFSAGLGLGSGVQVVLFGLMLNHAQLPRMARIAHGVARGAITLQNLVHEAPAVTLIASGLTLAAGASAMAYTGVFYIPEQVNWRDYGSTGGPSGGRGVRYH